VQYHKCLNVGFTVEMVMMLTHGHIQIWLTNAKQIKQKHENSSQPSQSKTPNVVKHGYRKGRFVASFAKDLTKDCGDQRWEKEERSGSARENAKECYQLKRW